jgi:hypothetical protein
LLKINVTWSALTKVFVRADQFARRVILTEAHVTIVLQHFAIRTLELHIANAFSTLNTVVVHLDGAVAILAPQLVAQSLLCLTKLTGVVATAHTPARGLITEKRSIHIALRAHHRHLAVLARELRVTLASNTLLAAHTRAVILARRYVHGRHARLLHVARLAHVATRAFAHVVVGQIDALRFRVVLVARIVVARAARALMNVRLAVHTTPERCTRAFELVRLGVRGLIDAYAVLQVLVAMCRV